MNDNKGFTEEEIDVLLPLLIHEGYLEKQILANGKVYYKRTNKQIPKQQVGDSV